MRYTLLLAWACKFSIQLDEYFFHFEWSKPIVLHVRFLDYPLLEYLYDRWGYQLIGPWEIFYEILGK